MFIFFLIFKFFIFWENFFFALCHYSVSEFQNPKNVSWHHTIVWDIYIYIYVCVYLA